MEIIATYSFKNGEQIIQENFPDQLSEVKEIIASVDASKLRTKRSEESTMEGKMLYAPTRLNEEYKKEFVKRCWTAAVKIRYEVDLPESAHVHSGTREMDFIKNGLGVEVQFGKYAFMAYDVFAKMPIFAKKGLIVAGIEIIPMYSFAREMSTGVSHFEMFKGDLDMRGESSIDIPVLIIGVDVKNPKLESFLK